MDNVRGIGVALITKICGDIDESFRDADAMDFILALCSTPNRCCSSMMMSPRLLYRTPVVDCSL